MSRRYTAYTDGSYNKLTGKYGAGFVLFEDGREEDLLSFSFEGTAAPGENGWQVNGEIAAAEKAIEEALKRGAGSLTVFCDYEGVAAWPDGRWKAKKPYTARYAESVRKSRQEIEITFVHVPGHSGNRYNEMADSLARKGCGL